jgi:hypothetical protein
MPSRAPSLAVVRDRRPIALADWRKYNHRRPHSSLNMKVPAVFAAVDSGIDLHSVFLLHVGVPAGQRPR